MIRILQASHDTTLSDARAVGDSLELSRADFERATGWVWKPEGLCRADTCIPIGKGIGGGDRLDAAALWRHLGWPVVHDSTAQIWVLGEGAVRRGEALQSLEAPDFELPDLDGHLHRLSDYRGRRVFLGTWASW